MDEQLLEPLNAYNNLKNVHNENVINYFDDLVKKSKIDVEENRRLIKKINNLKQHLEKNKTTRGRFIFLRVITIIGIVVFFILFTIFFLLLFLLNYFSFLDFFLPTIFLLIGIGLIVLNSTAIRKKLIDAKNEINKAEKKIKELTSSAWKNMKPLNDLYDWNIPAQIINTETKLIEFDKYFKPEKFQYLIDKYQFNSFLDKNTSVLSIQSGSILGNPFFVYKTLFQGWKNVTYTGSRVITWTEIINTRDGIRRVTRTQTLFANVVKPAPNYFDNTYLVYGNEAAPQLSFTRDPTYDKYKNLNDKKLDKIVRKKGKELDKREKRELLDGNANTNFQKMGNETFDVLFGAHNRNNEVEFRLLFTPLAQKNMINLIKGDPFSDDFYFTKKKKINIIESEHSQSFDYRAEPDIFINFNFDIARETFIKYNNEFFKNIYFDLAPLISIPLYQMNKTKEYIYNEELKFNTTLYDQEVLANQFNSKYFEHIDSKTTSILKSKFASKNKDTDNIVITAYSFNTKKRIENIPVLGGDGKMHIVPVEWIEYLPVQKDTNLHITPKNISRNAFNNLINSEQFKEIKKRLGPNHFERGLFAYIGTKESALDELNLNDIFGKIDSCENEIFKNIDDAVNLGIKEDEKLDNLELEKKEEIDNG